MADDTILETRGLTKEFKGFVAVKDVSLSVRRGSIHALIGPNGAGKTTCFNLLTHFLAPTRGQIFYNGREITDRELIALGRPARMQMIPPEGPREDFQPPEYIEDDSPPGEK